MFKFNTFLSEYIFKSIMSTSNKDVNKMKPSIDKY